MGARVRSRDQGEETKVKTYPQQRGYDSASETERLKVLLFR
jgi:hypothetical protein